MKCKLSGTFLRVLLLAILIAVMIPLTEPTAHAGHTCPQCQDWIDGEPYCSECYECMDCCLLCLECGQCTDCAGNGVCKGCTEQEASGVLCMECALDREQHCPEEGCCYYEVQSWCEECGVCEKCREMCNDCSTNLGHGLLCVDCAAEGEGHCQGCGQCFFKIQNWCEECMLCAECVTICEHCSVEAGAILCEECAFDAGMHCPSCEGCYGVVNEVLCDECGLCADCVEVCSTHDLCIECAIEAEEHCPNCEACDEEETLCTECGQVCSSCTDSMCESCNLCAECTEICPNCGGCSNCAEICPECGEYCSNCEGICDDCLKCNVCCQDQAYFEGCDCGDWVCPESGSWQEHIAEEHADDEVSHAALPLSGWSYSNEYHWHDCRWCDEPTHHTAKTVHAYDSYNTCTTCGYVKDARIQILKQPEDVSNVYVTSSTSAYEERNLAYFSVEARGDSELTYTWCRKMYSGGELVYSPLLNPDDLEDYDGPEAAILVPTDACSQKYTYCCIITDEDDNEVRTRDITVSARHNFHYYKYLPEHEFPYEQAESNQHGHVLQCVGDACERTSGLRGHVDDDDDRICDICDYSVTGILITKQPRDVKNVYVCSPDETYDKSNIAHFSVAASGDGELTYTWCRKMYSGGKLVYRPLTDPLELEDYEGPEIAILAPADACSQEYTYCCIITDQAGNEVRTMDVTLQAKHNYQYFEDYLSTRDEPFGTARIRTNGHVLQCVGESCEKKTRLRAHVDQDQDFACDICDKVKPIDTVSIHVTAPVEGQKPNYTVTCDHKVYRAMGDSSGSGQYRFWLVSDDGESSWSIMSKDATFVAGKHYKFTVDLETTKNREFAVYNYTTPNFATYINDIYVYGAASKTYNKDASHYTTITYVFGECGDSVIEDIVIDRVVTPVAGEKPVYTANVCGGGYSINTSKNSQEYCIKNGISWFDVTDNDWVYEGDTFIAGHEYRINIYLKTEDGYTFYLNKWYENQFSASINGTGAESINNGSFGLTEQRISASFICQPKEISTVMIYGLDAPQAGKNPDYTATTAYPDLYQIDPDYAGTNGIVWFDSKGYQLEPTDTFAEGEAYRVEIKVIPAKVDGFNATQFSKSSLVLIDGKAVEARPGFWDAVNVQSNQAAINVYYTFFEYAFSAQPQGGTVFVEETLNISWKTSFVPDATEIQYWDGEDWDQWDIQYNQTQLDCYDFVSVDAGTYHFRIVAYLDGKVRAISRSFSVTWKDTASAEWTEDGCTVRLDKKENGVTVMVASYESGKLVKVEYLTTTYETLLTGDNVKIFFLEEDDFSPIRSMLEVGKP